MGIFSDLHNYFKKPDPTLPQRASSPKQNNSHHFAAMKRILGKFYLYSGESARSSLLNRFDVNSINNNGNELEDKLKDYGGVDAAVNKISDYVFKDFENYNFEQDNTNNNPNAYTSAAEAVKLNNDYDNTNAAYMLGMYTSASMGRIDKLKMLGGLLAMKKNNLSYYNYVFDDIMHKFEILLDNAVNDLSTGFGGTDKEENLNIYYKAMKSVENLAVCTTRFKSLGDKQLGDKQSGGDDKFMSFKNTSEVNIIIREISSTAFSIFSGLSAARGAFEEADADSQKLNTFAGILLNPSKIKFDFNKPDPNELAKQDEEERKDNSKLTPAAVKAKQDKEKAERKVKRKAEIAKLQKECSIERKILFMNLDDTGKKYKVTDFKKNVDILNSVGTSKSDGAYFYDLLSEYEECKKNAKTDNEIAMYLGKISALKSYIRHAEAYYVRMFKISQLLREENSDNFSQEHKQKEDANNKGAKNFKAVQGKNEQAANQAKMQQLQNTPGFIGMSDYTQRTVTPEAIDYFSQKTREIFQFTDSNHPIPGWENAPTYNAVDGSITSQDGEWRYKLIGGKATEEEYRSLWKYTGYSGSINALAAGYKGGDYQNEYLGDDIDFDRDQRGAGTNMAGVYKDAEDLRNITSLISKSTYDQDVWLQSGQSFIGFEAFLGIKGVLEDMHKRIVKSKSQQKNVNNVYDNIFYSDEIVQANMEMKKYIGYMNEMPQFMSTSIYKGGGGGFNASAAVKLNIFAPKGSEMLYVSDIGHYHADEQEVILQRGGTYSISDIYWSFDTTNPSRKDPVLFVDMEIHPEHGYNKRQQ